MSNLSDNLYNIAQIRAAERWAIERQGIAAQQLMSDAAKAVFEQIGLHWPDQRRLTVFCGAGNNAGDGYVVAKLALQAGFEVKVYAFAAVESLKAEALEACQDFLQTSGARLEVAADGFDIRGVVVDALFGIGLSRPVSGEYIRAIEAINASGCPVVAVDIPSGLHADTGHVLGVAIKAHLTVTFIGFKCGLLTGEAADYCGEIVCASLGIDSIGLSQIEPTVRRLSKMPLPRRDRCGHKGRYGHVLLIGGNFGFSGAIRLAAETALRSGAGLVSVASRAEHHAFINIGRSELMCHATETFEAVSLLLEKASCIVIGPGLGQDEWAKTMLAAVLATDKPCVVDADALNLLAKQAQYRQHWILTPHPGEAARLLNCSTEQVGKNRFAALTELRRQYGGCCLLKGAGTLIACGDEVYVSTTGNPGMASGGMGDVLAGAIGGLLAQGLSMEQATQLAVYVHGEAGDSLAKQYGERGLLAGDMPERIRACLN